MDGRRVVITGMGAVSPFGKGVESLWQGLISGASAVGSAPSLGEISGLRTKVAAVVPSLDVHAIDRKKRRFMSKMSIFATLAAMEAMAQSKLDPADIESRRTGLCLGSTIGSPIELEEFFRKWVRDSSIENINSTFFFKIMNHSCVANVAQTLGIRGRIVAPSAACATGALAIGLASEMIATGQQEVVLCGGADEYHVATTAVFDIMNSSSCRYNDTPEATPRPFDQDRDGVVCSEGAGILVLESLDHAVARGAPILGEIMGFATLSSPGSLAHPDSETIEDCITAALETAKRSPHQVDYVNAHATATEHGDLAECAALEKALGASTPISSLKGHFGHAMAASGSLESIACLKMIAEHTLIPTRNLVTPDAACRHMNLPVEIRTQTFDVVLKNSFALGGVNVALIMGRYLA